MLAVCARWIDEDYQPRRALLSLPEIRHSHSGEHQSRIIFLTLDIYDIANQLGCHTGDNAASNDTCLQHLLTRLRQDRNVRRTPALFSHLVVQCIADQLGSKGAPYPMYPPSYQLITSSISFRVFT